jgi:hypothetical protein
MDDESILEIDEYENKFWRNKKNQVHRLDGPSIILTNGYEQWNINDVLHREDGPAIIYSNGFKKWYLNGCFYKTKEDWFDALSDEAKAKCLFSEDFLNG